MGKLIKSNASVLANNLEDLLAQLGMYSLPGQYFRLKFSDISALGGAALDANYFLASYGTHATGGAVSLSTNTLRLIPFYAPRDIHIDKLAFVVTVAGGAGSLARVGLYNASTIPPYLPTTLIVDAGEFDSNAVNGKIASVDVTLLGGSLYWAAYTCGVGAPTIVSVQTTYAEPYLGYQISASATTTTLTTGLSLARAYAALTSLTSNVLTDYTASGTGPAIFYRVN